MRDDTPLCAHSVSSLLFRIRLSTSLLVLVAATAVATPAVAESNETDEVRQDSTRTSAHESDPTGETPAESTDAEGSLTVVVGPSIRASQQPTADAQQRVRGQRESDAIPGMAIAAAYRFSDDLGVTSRIGVARSSAMNAVPLFSGVRLYRQTDSFLLGLTPEAGLIWARGRDAGESTEYDLESRTRSATVLPGVGIRANAQRVFGDGLTIGAEASIETDFDFFLGRAVGAMVYAGWRLD